MGFFGKIIGAAVKTILIPVAIADDALNVVTNQEVSTTEKLVDGVVEDLGDSVDDLSDGDL